MTIIQAATASLINCIYTQKREGNQKYARERASASSGIELWKEGKEAGGTGFTQETDNCVDAIIVDECEEAKTRLPLFAKNQVLIKFSVR